jgi:hypothetical protein
MSGITKNVPKNIMLHRYIVFISSISDGNIIFINSKAFKADGYGFPTKNKLSGNTALPLETMRFPKV